MEGETISLVIVCISAIISTSYCYYITSRIKAGVFRLLFVLPVCALFHAFPLFFSTLHISCCVSIFLAWLASFKLILFSFDRGPLFPLPSNIFRFICFTCLPIKAQQNPKPKNQIPKWVFPIKVAIFGVVLHRNYFDARQTFGFITLGCDLEPQFNEPYLATSLQDYWGRRWNLMIPAILRPAIYLPVRQLCRGRMSPDWARFLAVMATFIVSGVGHERKLSVNGVCHWSKNNETMTEITQLEIVLMLVKLLVFIILGCDLEPQFNEPYLATSLQDFWGRRWNLMVTQLLKPAIYIPVWRLCNGRMSSDHARFLAVMATFIFSGVAHEVFFFTLTFEMPTGEVACFFVLHGVCTAAEIAAKRTEFVRRWRVSPTVSRLFTVGFVVMTSGWLLFPTAARSNMLDRAANEALLSIDFFKRTFLYL
ncbi:hypothetical protein YC2023_015232 [Brassica napus]|uniref:Wax synthase domain-containing protein n=1 Tax=Brassica oleracea var. oleracea TaxID=109376 RepID=A0A0D3ALY9_BRAOL